jgi:DNA-binding response OmpR family regulator
MKKRIIIADDDPSIRDIFSIIFEGSGYDVDIRNTGTEILRGDFSTPDIFLIDRQLSGVDGLDVCRYLKSEERTKEVPVVMISASPDIGVLAKKAGADDFIEKPFHLHHLLETIRKNLREAPLVGNR